MMFKADSVDDTASCPYVTTIGATETVSALLGGYSEIASAAFPRYVPSLSYYIHLHNQSNPPNPLNSGGGLSNIFTMPSYQADVVKAYMSKYSPSDSGYNTRSVHHPKCIADADPHLATAVTHAPTRTSRPTASTMMLSTMASLPRLTELRPPLRSLRQSSPS